MQLYKKRFTENDHLPNEMLYMLEKNNHCFTCGDKIKIKCMNEICLVWKNKTNNEFIPVHMPHIENELQYNSNLVHLTCDKCLTNAFAHCIDIYAPLYNRRANKIIKWWQIIKHSNKLPRNATSRIIYSVLTGSSANTLNEKSANTLNEKSAYTPTSSFTKSTAALIKINAQLLHYNIYDVLSNLLSKSYLTNDKYKSAIADLFECKNNTIPFYKFLSVVDVEPGTITIQCRSLKDLTIVTAFYRYKIEHMVNNAIITDQLHASYTNSIDLDDTTNEIDETKTTANIGEQKN